MLFLLNQEVIDLGDPVEALQEAGVAGDLARMPTLAKIVALGQDAAFAAQGIEQAHPGIRRTLAALLGVSGEVNCALFLTTEKTVVARDVAVRLGQAPLTTMALLLSAQQSGRLTAQLINHHVWRVAGGVAAA